MTRWHYVAALVWGLLVGGAGSSASLHLWGLTVALSLIATAVMLALLADLVVIRIEDLERNQHG